MSVRPFAEQHAQQQVERAVAEPVAAAIGRVAALVVANAGDEVEIVGTSAATISGARVAS